LNGIFLIKAEAYFYPQNRLIMTKRDFFIIIIRLFGVYLLFSTVFSSLIGTVWGLMATLTTDQLVWIVISLFVILALFVALIFYAEHVVGLLRLDRGFDDLRIEFGSVQRGQLLGVAVLILGGMLFANNLPYLLNNLLNKLTSVTIQDIHVSVYERYSWVVPGISLMVGYLLIINQHKIGHWLAKQSKIDDETGI
jgi:hypothetical protein